MRPLAEAQSDVLAAVPALPTKTVGVDEALGLVLAADVVAPHDVPPFANSAMDGFAVRAADVADAPVELEILEDVAAGHVAHGSVQPATAIKIMTGAPVPGGADTIVKVEDTEPGSTDRRIRILTATAHGTAVRDAGGDWAAGDRVFDVGERLTARHLGVLASLGVSPLVHRRPRVAVLSTGDEVMAPDTAELEPGQIRDSNRPLIKGLLKDLGAEVLDMGIVRDDADALRSTLSMAAAEADAILTSGGVSMGEYDLVKIILRELGTIEFWQVAMQPAKPFAFGHVDGVPLFGLPGNPVSVMVAFEQFARPALLTMMGARQVFRQQLTATAAESWNTDPAKVVFTRVNVSGGASGPEVTLSGGQMSNVLSAMARADAFAVVPVGVGPVEVGDSVTIELFRSPEQRSREEAIGGG